MAPITKLGPLNDKEKAEFDNIRYDEIQSCKDVKKLMRMEAYFREQAFPTTADAVVARLRELGQRAANAEVDPEQARLLAEEQARASAEIAAWTAKQRQTDAALEAACKEAFPGLNDGAVPPVRAPVRLATEEKKAEAALASQKPAKPKVDSAVGTNIRSGQEYYGLWEKKVQTALAEADRDGENGVTAAPAGTAAAAASTAGLKRSPELTQRLLELNRSASAAERLILSGTEKVKGNDHFRAKEYAEAVEHYTLALGLRGSAGEASLFNNRAAAYIKLKMWDAAEQDTTAALETDPKLLKAYIRRAAARLELGKLAEVVTDCDAALALQPGTKEAEGMRERAVKLLQDAGVMKRMAIEEVDDEEEEDDVEGEGKVTAAKISSNTNSSSSNNNGVGASPSSSVAVVPPASSESTQQPLEGQTAAGGCADRSSVGGVGSHKPLPPPGHQGDHHAAAPVPAPALARKKLVVVEESDSSEDGDEHEEAAGDKGMGQVAAAVAPTAVAQTSPRVKQQQQQQPAPAIVANTAMPNNGSNAGPIKPSAPTASLHAAPAAVATAPHTHTHASSPSPASTSRLAPAVAAAPAATGSAAAATAAAVVLPRPPPSPPPVELPPPPSSPPPTPVSQFDAFVESIKQEGNREFNNGNRVRAAQLYTEALALAPDLGTLYLNRSMARLSTGLSMEALRDACQAVALDPNNYKAYNKRARAKEKLRLWESSRDDMQRCLDLVPAKDERNRAEVAKELERAHANLAAAKERAVARAAAAAARGPQRVTKYARAGVTIEEHDDDEDDSDGDKPLLAPDEATDWEVAAARRLPQLRSNAEELRTEWLRQRDAEAREAYQRELLAWEAAKEQAEAAQEAAAAVAAAAAEEAAAAAAAGTEAGGAPRGVEAIKNEGNAHLKAQRYRQAEDCYRECLRLDPDNLPVRLNLLVLLNATERWAEAETGANQVLELLSASQSSLNPDQQHNMRSKVFHRRAQALKAQGRLQEALGDLRAAKVLFGQSDALDREMEALGKLIAAPQPSTAQVPIAAAAAMAAGTEAVAPAAATVEARVLAAEAVVEACAAEPDAAAAAAQKPAAAPMQPFKEAAVRSVAETGMGAIPPPLTGPLIGTTAASGTNAMGSRSTWAVDGLTPAPVRRRMEVQVESDSDDSQEDAIPTLPLPPSSPPSKSPPPSPSLKPPPPSPTCAAAAAVSANVGRAPAAAATPPAAATTQSNAKPTPSPATVAASIPPVTTASSSAAATAAASAPVAASGTGKNGGARSPEVSGDPGDPSEAARLRDEGNRLHGVGNYVRAMDFYTRSIRACAHNPASYCNRAFVYLHLRRPADALLDAEAAIEQSGGRYPKAQLRRALALRELGRIPEAIAAVRQLLEAAPSDAALLEEMQRLQRMAADGAVTDAAASQGQGQRPAVRGGVAAAAAPAAPVQAPPVRHKIIVDMASDSEDDREEEEMNGAAGITNTMPPGTVTATPQPEATAATPVAAGTAGSNQATSASSGPGGGAAVPASSAASAPAPTLAPPQPAASTGAGGVARSPLEAASAKAAAALAVAARNPKKPKPPKNAHELEQTLKSLAPHPAVQYDYLRSLEPSSYAGVIKANLSVKMLQAFVDAARHAMGLISADGLSGAAADASTAAAVPSPPIPRPVDVEYAMRSLEGLTVVSRFDVTYGLCGKAMKDDMRVLVGALAAAGRDVSLLKKWFKL